MSEEANAENNHTDLLSFHPSSDQSADEFLKTLVEDPKYDFVFGLGELKGPSLNNPDRTEQKNSRKLIAMNDDEENYTDDDYSLKCYRVIRVNDDLEALTEESEPEMEQFGSGTPDSHAEMLNDFNHFETIENAFNEENEYGRNEKTEIDSENDDDDDDHQDEVEVEERGYEDQVYEDGYENSYIQMGYESEEEPELIFDKEYNDNDNEIDDNGNDDDYDYNDEEGDHEVFDQDYSKYYNHVNYEENAGEEQFWNDGEYDDESHGYVKEEDDDDGDDEEDDESENDNENDNDNDNDSERQEEEYSENGYDDEDKEEQEYDKKLHHIYEEDEDEEQDNEIENENENENVNDYDGDAYHQAFSYSLDSQDQLQLNDMYYGVSNLDEMEEWESDNGNQAPQQHITIYHNQNEEHQYMHDNEHDYDDGDNDYNEDDGGEYGEDVELINLTENNDENAYNVMDFYNESDFEFEYFNNTFDASNSNVINFPYQDGMTIEEMAKYMTLT